MNTHIVTTFISSLFVTIALHAQEPQFINYQGRVTVNGVNFDGSGLFKFAIVDATGTTTYWSNDGTSTAGNEPAAAVTLTVTAGVYSVILGDTTLPNMAAIPAGALNNSEVFLRVWFNDGTNGSEVLTPDQRLEMDCATTIPNAWQEHNEGAPPDARAGHTAVWTGSAMIVWGGRPVLDTAGRYDPAAHTWTAVTTTGAPTGRSSHSAVWTGSEMIVWGGVNDSGPLNNGGRYNPADNTWTAMTTTGAPSARRLHTAVWTGGEMIVWGGATGLALGIGSFNNGGGTTQR